MGGITVSTKSILHRGGSAMRRARALVAERDGAVCRRCGEGVDMTLSGMDPNGPNLGHIVAAANGGSDAIDNLGIEHRRCNLAAGSRRTPPRATIAVPMGAE